MPGCGSFERLLIDWHLCFDWFRFIRSYAAGRSSGDVFLSRRAEHPVSSGLSCSLRSEPVAGLRDVEAAGGLWERRSGGRSTSCRWGC